LRQHCVHAREIGAVLFRQRRLLRPHVLWDTHVDWADVDPGDGLPRKGAPQPG
jgi:hypothetical protein